MLAALLGSGGVISTLFCSSFLPKLQLSQSCDNILIPVKCFSQSTVFNPKSIRGAAGREQEGSVPPRKVCQLHLGVRMGTDCFGLWILSELLPFIFFTSGSNLSSHLSCSPGKTVLCDHQGRFGSSGAVVSGVAKYCDICTWRFRLQVQHFSHLSTGSVIELYRNTVPHV